jgi:hypothetical protein
MMKTPWSSDVATVTRKFRDDFECWAADRLAKGVFTPGDMDEFKDLLRRDLTPGADQLRAGLTVIIAAGVEVPATIDDHEERNRLWSDYFAVEAESIRNLKKEKHQ